VAAASSRSSAPSTSTNVALGSTEPRIFTPPLRKLTPKTSLGFECIDFAETVCGVELYPWQKWLLIHALELHPAGGFRYRTIVVLVARQQGKSMLSVILSLFFMYCLGRALVIGTAQDLDVAEEIWTEAVDLVEETPELNALKKAVVKTNGKKALELTSGERYKVKAANRRAGRGLSGELILLDELREHQTFDAWGAITKTTIARPDAQVWALSNAGDATSVVLRFLRKKAHAALGDPDGINAEGRLADELVGEELDDDDESTLAIFEWSAPPGTETTDRKAWRQANPALGYGLVTERTLISAQQTDPEWVFRTEVMCQWSDGTLEGPFPPGTWEAGQDPESEIDGDAVKFCLDTNVERTRSYIAVAGRRADSIPHVEVIEARAGTSWVGPWFEARAKDYEGGMDVVVQRTGAPASSLIEELQAIDGVNVIEWGGVDLGRGTGAFFDAVALPNAAGLRHRPQPLLDVAAAVASVKYLGDGAIVLDRRKSPADVAPLVAVVGAHWALLQRDEEPDISVYEDRGLVSL
jgi:hypothetical protein